MQVVGEVSKERLEAALQQIRSDVATLHRDLGYGAGNQARWTFLLMWLVVADLLRDGLDLSWWLAVAVSVVIVGAYRIIDGMRTTARALRRMEEPVEPSWDTRVEL